MKKLRSSKKKSVPTSKLKSIVASSAQIGKIYLTKLGVQVIVKKIALNGVQVVPEFASKTLVVKKDSLLFTCPSKRITKKNKLHFKSCREKWKEESISENSTKTQGLAAPSVQPSNDQGVEESPSPTQVRRGPKGPRKLSVTNVVDPMLFAGIYTREQMIEALAKSEVGQTLTNKDYGWYVAYRIAVLKEKGYTVDKLENGLIKASKFILNLNLQGAGV